MFQPTTLVVVSFLEQPSVEYSAPDGFATGGNWWKSPNRRTFIPPNGTVESAMPTPVFMKPVIWEVRVIRLVVSMLILLIASQSVFVILVSLLAFISFDINLWSIQSLLFSVFITGRPAHQCNVVPPMTIVATPDIAILASRWQTPLCSKDFVIIFNNVDFLVPPGLITIISICFGLLPAWLAFMWDMIMSCARRCSVFREVSHFSCSVSLGLVDKMKHRSSNTDIELGLTRNGCTFSSKVTLHFSPNLSFMSIFTICSNSKWCRESSCLACFGMDFGRNIVKFLLNTPASSTILIPIFVYSLSSCVHFSCRVASKSFSV